MQRRMDDMETYLRRRNLRIGGIPENAHEDIRLEVIKICQNVLPSAKDKLSDVIDVVHRLGKIQQSGTERYSFPFNLIEMLSGRPQRIPRI